MHHDDDVLLCRLYGFFFLNKKKKSTVRGRWVDVSDALGTTRTQNACRHRYNLIKTRSEMQTAIADGASRTEPPERSKRAREDGEAVVGDGGVAVAGGAHASNAAGGIEESEQELINALYLAQKGEEAAAARSEKKKRRGVSEAQKREEAGRLAANDSMVWSTEDCLQ